MGRTLACARVSRVSRQAEPRANNVYYDVMTKQKKYKGDEGAQQQSHIALLAVAVDWLAVVTRAIGTRSP